MLVCLTRAMQAAWYMERHGMLFVIANAAAPRMYCRSIPCPAAVYSALDCSCNGVMLALDLVAAARDGF